MHDRFPQWRTQARRPKRGGSCPRTPPSIFSNYAECSRIPEDFSAGVFSLLKRRANPQLNFGRGPKLPSDIVLPPFQKNE